MTRLALPDGMQPDLELARAYIEQQPLPGRMLLFGVTGAHHYGFPSPDSDLDLKGLHLAPTRDLLGLRPPGQTYDRTEFYRGVECDLTSHEAAKSLALLLRGNGNMLERILSPFQVIESPELPALQQLAQASLSKRFFAHYGGYLKGMQLEHEREPRVKSMLYTYRVALTGIHLLATGELEADVRINAPRYGFPEVLELVEQKAKGLEKASLTGAVDANFRQGWAPLQEQLEGALENSSLEEEAPNFEAIDRWLVELRAKEL